MSKKNEILRINSLNVEFPLFGGILQREVSHVHAVKDLSLSVCQGETIYDSPSEYADDMRSILQEQINNGMTDNDIYEFWVTRYGERIITNPIEKNYEIVLIPLFLVLIFIYDFLRKLYVKK